MAVILGRCCYERVKSCYEFELTDEVVEKFKKDTEGFYQCPDWFHEVTPEIIGIVYGEKADSDLYDEEKFETKSFVREGSCNGKDYTYKNTFYDVIIDYFNDLIWEGNYEQIDVDTDYSEDYMEKY